jgi:PAS domain S-box-containing protein
MMQNAEDPHYRLLFESAPDAILVVDDAGQIRMNNHQAEKLLEAAVGELLGMNVERLVPMAARKKHVHLRTNFVQTTNSRPMGVGLSLHAVKLNGREFPVEISLSSTHREGRRETIVVMRDVSERLAARRTESELRRAKTLTTLTELALRERDFQSLSEQVVKILLEPIGADLVLLGDRLSKDESYLIRAAFGDSADVIRGTNIDAALISDELRHPILVGDDANSPHAILPLGAQLRFRSYISAPLFQNGEMVGAISMASRTPHRFTSEDVAFVEAVTNVISTALERSEAEEKLMDSMRLESLGKLTGGLAHDFNNLLAVISGNLQILQLPSINETEKARAIAAAQRASRSGADLTSKLLAFSRRQTLNPTQVNVEKLLTSFKELLLRTLGTGIQIELAIARNLPLTLVDEGQLEAALLNLVVNARDAMPQGGNVKITAEVEEPGAYVKIGVEDNGTGMPADVMERVFEPFFTTKAIGKGSGLGLSMVYGFAKQSAGHISVQSKLGVGTRFDLLLPTFRDKLITHSDVLEVSLERGDGEKVLIIEDDQAVLNVAQQFFQALGYRTVSSATKASALERLRENDDTVLVFSDVILGANETGPQVCEALLAVKPSLRILLTSGYARANLQSQLSADESVELLRKPYTLEALAQAARRALS